MNTAQALGKQGIDLTVAIPKLMTWPFTSDEAQLAKIREFYNIPELSFRVSFLPTLPKTSWELEKNIRGFFAPLLGMNSYDLLYTRYYFGLFGSLLAGKRLVFENHYNIPKRFPYRFKLLKWGIERNIVLGMVTNGHFVRKLLTDAGLPQERILPAHNGFDERLLQAPENRDRARAKLDIPRNQKIVFYGGSIGSHKNSNLLLSLANRMPDVVFMLAGRPDEATQSLVRTRTNVRLTGWLDPDALARHLYAADVLIIPPTAIPMEQFGNTVLPIKTFQYLAVGKPIVAPDQIDLKEVLHSKNALLVPPDDENAAINAIRTGLENISLAQTIGKQAREDAAQYTWTKRGEKIATFLRTLRQKRD